ncbi:MAG TPA: dephospho-CoA kinase [Actinomycetota bacterium]|nr:dephospho-CoA kinase [Actinomycetota bacterium]
MLLVGLTGGIGSGKSTAAGMLAERGAVVFDADALARDALRQGTDTYAEVVRAFGREIVGADDEIDRAKLARLVFADGALRGKLERIVHPDVRRRFEEAVEPHRDTGGIVVYDAPLIVEAGRRAEFDVLVVVTAPAEAQVARLEARGMPAEEARARMAAQMPTEDKAEQADFVLDNGGTTAELEAQVNRLWRDLVARAGRRPIIGP